MHKYFFVTKKNTVNVFCDKISIYGLFADFPLTGRPCLSMGGSSSHWEARSLTGRPLIGRLGLFQGGQDAGREAGPLNRRQGFTQGGRSSHREAGPLTGSLGL